MRGQCALRAVDGDDTAEAGDCGAFVSSAAPAMAAAAAAAAVGAAATDGDDVPPLPALTADSCTADHVITRKV